jgi:NAD(P)-dependent dehydrogenase (short-subunit alcohol dehydrogenase family)
MPEDQVIVEEVRVNNDERALIVTGAPRGIGAQVARRAAAGGTPVALFYRSSAEPAKRVVDDIESAGGRAVALQADLGREEEVVRAFETVDRELGPLGGLVNNAVSAGEPTRLADLRGEQVERILRVNVAGVLLCAREAARRMSTRAGGAGGAIVSMSSSRAVNTGGAGGWLPLAASKAAIEVVSRGLAADLAEEGIRVNVVRVGVADTETRRSQGADYVRHLVSQVPMRRIGTVDEMSAAVLWLLSPQASYVTGATLDVTGGL